MPALCERPALELRRLIGSREISPVELVADCIARIDALNPGLNAIVTGAFDSAREAAQQAEQVVLSGTELGPLHGLPVAVKDLHETADLRTTYGSPQFADHVPTEDAAIIARLKAAGAIVIGKTNTPEFGAGANTTNPVFGPTRNPFDPDRTCGGSSGGSAVALATDMAPLATGSDLGGSLRIPASFCGVAGYRASPGLVPSESRLLGWSPLTVDGMMARSIPDLALSLDCVARFDGLDPLAHAGPRLHPLPPVDLSTLRVAWSADLGLAVADRRIAAAFAEKIATIPSAFAAFEQTHPDFSGADPTFDVLRAESFLAKHKAAYDADPDSLGPNVRANVELGLSRSLGDAAEAHRCQTEISRRLEAFLADHDILICPATTVPPFSVENLYLSEIDGVELDTYYRWFAITYALSLTGHPVAVIPFGLDPTGTPMGLQVVGPRAADLRTLSVAAALEAAFAAHPQLCRPRPPLGGTPTG